MGYKGRINGRLNVWSGGSSASFVERIASAYSTRLATHLEKGKIIVLFVIKI